MRLAIIGVITVAAAFAADVQAASAVNYESFFQERYCSRKPTGRWNCAYKTLEQCDRIFAQLPDGGVLPREPMVARASTADHARQEPSAQWLEAGSALAADAASHKPSAQSLVMNRRTVFPDGEGSGAVSSQIRNRDSCQARRQKEGGTA